MQAATHHSHKLAAITGMDGVPVIYCCQCGVHSQVRKQLLTQRCSLLDRSVSTRALRGRTDRGLHPVADLAGQVRRLVIAAPHEVRTPNPSADSERLWVGSGDSQVSDAQRFSSSLDELASCASPGGLVGLGLPGVGPPEEGPWDEALSLGELADLFGLV